MDHERAMEDACPPRDEQLEDTVLEPSRFRPYHTRQVTRKESYNYHLEHIPFIPGGPQAVVMVQVHCRTAGGFHSRR